MPQHHLVEDLTASLANEPVVSLVEPLLRNLGVTYVSSMSLPLGLTRGWTWLLSFVSALKAGLGFGRT
ncbi:hypothetical protein IMZ48_29530 [Candidatus Bathyarchaeota archaeon]|nr:hypothetical protein [Candidatus Bathyarchaeota archaeon]